MWMQLDSGDYVWVKEGVVEGDPQITFDVKPLPKAKIRYTTDIGGATSVPKEGIAPLTVSLGSMVHMEFQGTILDMRQQTGVGGDYGLEVLTFAAHLYKGFFCAEDGRLLKTGVHYPFSAGDCATGYEGYYTVDQETRKVTYTFTKYLPPPEMPAQMTVTAEAGIPIWIIDENGIGRIPCTRWNAMRHGMGFLLAASESYSDYAEFASIHVDVGYPVEVPFDYTITDSRTPAHLRGRYMGKALVTGDEGTVHIVLTEHPKQTEVIISNISYFMHEGERDFNITFDYSGVSKEQMTEVLSGMDVLLDGTSYALVDYGSDLYTPGRGPFAYVMIDLPDYYNTPRPTVSVEWPETIVDGMRISAGSFTVPNVILVGPYKIGSEPSGAAIWVDGIDTGFKTPTTLWRTPLGQHITTLKLANYNTYETGIDILWWDGASGSEYNLFHTFTPQGGLTIDIAASVAAGGIPDTIETGKDEWFTLVISNTGVMEGTARVLLRLDEMGGTRTYPEDLTGLMPEGSNSELFRLPGSHVIVEDAGYTATGLITIPPGESKPYPFAVWLPHSAVPIGTSAIRYAIIATLQEVGL